MNTSTQNQHLGFACAILWHYYPNPMIGWSRVYRIPLENDLRSSEEVGYKEANYSPTLNCETTSADSIQPGNAECMVWEMN
jgi:hypothetical protein